MRKNSVLNDKLVVQPVFISLQHKHVFMGHVDMELVKN